MSINDNVQIINLPVVLHTTTNNTVSNTGFFTSSPTMVFATMTTFAPYATNTFTVPYPAESWELEPVELPDWFPQCECGEAVSAGEDFCLDCLGTQVQDAPNFAPILPGWSPEKTYYSKQLLGRLVPALVSADHGLSNDVYQTLHMGQGAYLTSKFSTTNVRTIIGSDPALSTGDQIVINWTVTC